MPEARLQKVISAAGLMSRRHAEELIATGRVRVDGRVAILGDRCDPSTARVEIDGVPIPVAPGLVTYLLYKPAGVISTASDPQGRRTVVDLLPDDPRVWPVGRLDADSEGLMLLTNDGELTNRITHPSFEVTKTYVALVEGVPTSGLLRRLTTGIELEDGLARAHSVRILDRSVDSALIEIVMGEGRKREVRRMFDAVDHPVRRLVRVAIGPLVDKALAPGEWRRLTPSEVAKLYAAASSG